MRRTSGVTIIELLIAIVIIGVAFGALAMSQITTLRATASARTNSEVKAAANRALEQVMGEIVRTEAVTNGSSLDDDPGTDGRSFHFIDYYYRCPTNHTPTDGTRGNSLSNLRSVTCNGTANDDGISTTWTIVGEGGTLGEGVIRVTVTSQHNAQGSSLTLVNRITCYDVYPTPVSTAPAPCPEPNKGRL